MIEYNDFTKGLSFSEFKRLLGHQGEFKFLQGEEKEKALAAKWQEITGKKIGTKVPEIEKGV